MRAFVSSTREPMKPESRPRSEQGLASALNLAGPLITSSDQRSFRKRDMPGQRGSQQHARRRQRASPLETTASTPLDELIPFRHMQALQHLNGRKVASVVPVGEPVRNIDFPIGETLL